MKLLRLAIGSTWSLACLPASIQKFRSKPVIYRNSSKEIRDTTSGVVMEEAVIVGVGQGGEGRRRTTPRFMVARRIKASSVMISRLVSLAEDGSGCSGSSEASSSVGLPKSILLLAFSESESSAASYISFA